MTDNTNDQPLDQGQEVDNVADHDYTEVELQAIEHGWKPREEYEGDPAKWRDAQLFMTLKPFYERIESQNRQIKENKKAFLQIAKDMQQVKDAAYRKAVADLKAQKKDAMQEGDFDRVELLEDQLGHIHEQKRIQDAQQQAIESDPVDQSELLDWQKRNTWYERDEDLRDWADARGVKLFNQGIDRSEVLRQLEQEVKKKFPEKFTNPNRDRASAVTAGVKSPAKAEKLDMSPEEIRIMENIVRTGAITKEEYLKQYKAQK